MPSLCLSQSLRAPYDGQCGRLSPTVSLEMRPTADQRGECEADLFEAVVRLNEANGLLR